MIDYFALLEQPPAPWIDQDELRAVYHRKTLEEHPDVQENRGGTGRPGINFSELNDAYQVLQDPKRRLQHLLTLEGHPPPAGNQSVPEQLQDLFPVIGDVTNRIRLLLEQIRTASSSLSQALLKPQILELQNQTKELRDKIQNLSTAALAELRQINESWMENRAEQIVPLSNLYFVFAYLNRWSAQLDEMVFQLSLH